MGQVMRTFCELGRGVLLAIGDGLEKGGRWEIGRDGETDMLRMLAVLIEQISYGRSVKFNTSPIPYNQLQIRKSTTNPFTQQR